ncbi:MAG: 4Fe-4S dicluster domain-containing protein [Candidatus Electrothrix sp. GW3-4]|uniref:4Fe-4S dicluster domain-containing protein n=1 Tax=Candidatus Electrothrix sp. GW3-4 TaxID=3126740 RepID=UPI0030CE3642
MGHITNSENGYHLLQNRLSQKVQGNSESETLIKILQMLFSPEDAALAGKLPHRLTPIDVLATELGLPEREFAEKIIEMAKQGIIFDLVHKGRRYVMLPPVVIGFFEFVFMRVRPDLPMQELAHLFETYFNEEDGILFRSFWQGQTQQTRTFVMEETIPQNDHAEILDWERATQVIFSATAISVGKCQCHHTAQHHGTACDKPEEVCLTFNYIAESLAKKGHARAISKDEAKDILRRCKEHNLIQIGDNVQRKVAFICNCCSCCCHLLRGIRNYEVKNGVVSSNWIMGVDLAKCTGCGKCVKVCPVGAIQMNESEDRGHRKRWVSRDASICLGCGVCSKVCRSGGAVMQPRAQRTIAPETIFDQQLSMAVERGRLAELLFDHPEKLSHRALGRLVKLIEQSAPFRAAMASEAIKSSLVEILVKGAKKQIGDLAEELS